MATADARGMHPATAAYPHRQLSPAVMRSAGFCLPGVVRYWRQRESPVGGVARGQPDGKLHLGAMQFTPYHLSAQMDVANLNAAASKRASPGRPNETERRGAEASQLQGNAHPVVWRSLTPPTYSHSAYRPAQGVGPRPASTGCRAAAPGLYRQRGQPFHQLPNNHPQASNMQPSFCGGSWARPADRVPVPPQQCFGTAQQNLSLGRQMQRNADPAVSSATQGISLLQSRLGKLHGQITSPAAAYGIGAQEHASYPQQQWAAGGNPQQPHFWRPLSVSPQCHGRLRNVKFVPVSCSSGQLLKEAAPMYVSPVGAQDQQSVQSQHGLQGAGLQADFKRSRSVSTPPLASRQSPSLASRIWSLFQTPAAHTSPEKTHANECSFEREPPATTEALKRQTGHSVSWASSPRDNSQELKRAQHIAQRGLYENSQLSHHDSPPLPRVAGLLQGASRQSPLSSPQTNGARTFVQQRQRMASTGHPETSDFQMNFQQVTPAPQTLGNELPASQHREGILTAQPPVQLPTFSAQPPQQLLSRAQMDHFIWQQQQILRRQQGELQQQKEKLMQEQASWQQRKQKSSFQKETQPQFPPTSAGQLSGAFQAKSEKQNTSPYHQLKPKTGASSHFQEEPVPHWQERASPIQESPRSSTQRTSATESAPVHGVDTASLESTLQGANPEGQRLKTPAPLEWQVHQPSSEIAYSASSALTNIEGGKLSFTAVGGSMEERMQLTCEVIVDPGAKLIKGALAPEISSRNVETDEGKAEPQVVHDTEGCDRPSSGSTRATGSIQEDGENSPAAAVATARSAYLPTVPMHRSHVNIAAESDVSGKIEAAKATSPGAGQAAMLNVPRGEPYVCSPPFSKPVSQIRLTQHDIIPVGPLIAAVSAAGGWGGQPQMRGGVDDYSAAVKDIDSYLPIRSLSELESVEKGQQAYNLLDLRRDVVGCGTYGVVRKLRHRKGGFVLAIKSIQKETVVRAGMVNQVEFELYVQRDLLRHNNVLRCFSCFEDAEYLHMVLGYCEHGDLYRWIREQPNRRFSELEAFSFFSQLVNGLQCVHSSGIIHRDLKLENLLITKDNVLKIADFGWCGSVVGRNRSFSFCGTLDYLAPEMVKGQGHDWRVDLWSLGGAAEKLSCYAYAGVLLYELLDGRPPFQSTRHFELIQRIVTVDIRMPYGRRLLCFQHVKKDAADLITKLLKYEPSERLPLVDVAQHPWVLRMWKELQLYLLQLNPTVDLEALIPAPPDSSHATGGTPPHIFSPLRSSDAQEVHCRATEMATPRHSSVLAARPGGFGKTGTPKAGSRCLFIQTRQQPVGAANSSSSGSRRSPGKTGVDLNHYGKQGLSAAWEKSPKKSALASKVHAAPSSVQPSRRTLSKASPMPAQTRVARSTSKVAASVSARQVMLTRVFETAEAGAAETIAKRAVPKWRSASVIQKSRSRTAPLVDESFDLPVPEEVCKDNDPPAQTRPLAVASGDKEELDDLQTNRQEVSERKTANGCEQCLSPRIAECRAGGSSYQQTPPSAKQPQPTRSAVTFCLDEESRQELSQPTTDKELSTVRDATTLPSVKRLRNISAHQRNFGAGGAVLRKSPNADDLSGFTEQSIAGFLSQSRRPARLECHGPVPASCGDVAIFPERSERVEPTFDIQQNFKTPSPFGASASPAYGSPHVSPVRSPCLVKTGSKLSEASRLAAKPCYQGGMAYKGQWHAPQTVHPNGFACSQGVQLSGGHDPKTGQWYEPLLKGTSFVCQTPFRRESRLPVMQAGGGRPVLSADRGRHPVPLTNGATLNAQQTSSNCQHVSYGSFWGAQKQRLVDLLGPATAGQPSAGAAGDTGSCDSDTRSAGLHAGFPQNLRGLKTAYRIHQSANSEFSAADRPPLSSALSSTTLIPRLPVVLAAGPPASTPKFVSNPSSLFC